METADKNQSGMVSLSMSLSIYNLSTSLVSKLCV